MYILYISLSRFQDQAKKNVNYISKIPKKWRSPNLKSGPQEKRGGRQIATSNFQSLQNIYDPEKIILEISKK